MKLTWEKQPLARQHRTGHRWLACGFAAALAIYTGAALAPAQAEDATPSRPEEGHARTEPLYEAWRDVAARLTKYASSAEQFADSEAERSRDAALAVALWKTLATLEPNDPAADVVRQRLAWACRLLKAENYDGYRLAVEQLFAEAPPDVTEQTDCTEQLELVPMMTHVSRLLAGLRRNAMGSRFERRAADGVPQAALIAAVASVTEDANQAYTADEPQAARWREIAREMADAAHETCASLAQLDQQGTRAALARLEQSCQACHELVGVEAE